MIITRKHKIAIVFVSLAVSFAVGRYTVSEKTITVTKVVEVEKKVEDKIVVAEKKTHTKETTTTIRKPDGTIITTIVATDDSTNLKTTDSQTVVDKQKQTDSKVEVSKGDSQTTVSVLGGYDVNQSRLVYGASVSRPVLGPISIGLWALTSPSFGASVGISF